MGESQRPGVVNISFSPIHLRPPIPMAPAQTLSPPWSPDLQPCPFQVALQASPREMFLRPILTSVLHLSMAPHCPQEKHMLGCPLVWLETREDQRLHPEGHICPVGGFSLTSSFPVFFFKTKFGLLTFIKQAIMFNKKNIFKD